MDGLNETRKTEATSYHQYTQRKVQEYASTEQGEAIGEYYDHGFAILPVRCDGSKAPAVANWRELQQSRPTREGLLHRFSAGNYGVGVIGGAISGNLEILDFDDYSAWQEVSSGLQARLIALLPCVATPSGGFHHYYRRHVAPDGNHKLACAADHKTLIETRGNGGYVVAPPSPPGCHSTGLTYEWLRGGPRSVPRLSERDVERLHRECRRLDRRPKDRITHVAPIPSESISAVDRYNETADMPDFLEHHGWRVCGRRGDNIYLCRPGKNGGISASWHVVMRVLYVFSSNAYPFEPWRAYNACSILSLLDFQGDRSGAIEFIRSL